MTPYVLHGIKVFSEVPLGIAPSPVDTSGFLAKLRIRKGRFAERPRYKPSWYSDQHYADGTPWFSYARAGQGHLFMVPDVGQFLIEQESVTAWIDNPNRAPAYLLGRVFGIWLEMNGFPVLHGSSVIIGGYCYGFIARSGHGKSTLSAALHESGKLILTDDLIPLTPEPPHNSIYPGLPVSRLWADSGARFIEDFDSFDKVLPHLEKRKVVERDPERPRFASKPCDLAAIYVLDRQPADSACETISIQTCSPTESLLELIRHSYFPELVHEIGLQDKRLQLLSTLNSRIPLKRLTYPSGFELLPEVVSEIVLDAAQSTNRLDLERNFPSSSPHHAGGSACQRF